MTGLLAPLSPSERDALLSIGFGPMRQLDPNDLRRLLQLDLVSWNGWRWEFTALGRLRYNDLVHDQSAPRPLA